jgi:hypothetical protein
MMPRNHAQGARWSSGALAFAIALMSVPSPATAGGLRHGGDGLSHYEPCSVLADRPCFQYRPFCSVFDHQPCLPDTPYPYGQQLRLTIGSKAVPPDRPAGDLDTIRDVFAVLRACWVPPAPAESREGAQLTVRLSFKRDGELFGQPTVTYASPDLSSDLRRHYLDAVSAMLARCTPLAWTRGLGGALAGRPFAIRVVDDRSF